MRSRSRSSKSSRPTTLAASRRTVGQKLRKYLPWAAVICAGAYLPPKVLSVNYKWNGGDADGKAWNLPANWAPTGVPTALGDTATFDTNFTLNRTITLDTQTALSSLTMIDPKAPSTLTIQGTGTTNQFKLDPTNGLTLNTAMNNTLQIIPPANTTQAMLVDNAAGGKLIKTGLGTVVLSGDNSYTGSTTIDNGILQVSKLANAGQASNIGASTKFQTSDPNSAPNLVFAGGTLRYTGPAVSTDRSIMLMDDVLNSEGGLAHAAGTIDSSGSGVITFTDVNGVIKGSPNPLMPSTLVLRGTTGTGGSAGAGNQLDIRLADGNGGGSLTVLKTDTGAWRITNKDNSYTGDTIAQRGILTLDYAKGAAGTQRIPDASRLVFGGLPGGGTVDIVASGVFQEDTSGFVVRQGANVLQSSANGGGTPNGVNNGGAFFYIPQLRTSMFRQDPGADNFNAAEPFYRTPGGTLRMPQSALIQTDQDVPPQTKNFGGWLTIENEWVTVVPVGNSPTATRYNTTAYNTVHGYVTSNSGGAGAPDTWLPTDNVDITGTSPFPLDSSGNTLGYKDIFSLRFSGAPTPTKALIMVDQGVQPSTLNIAGGGLMQQSNSGNSQIIGGVVTSAGGELYINVRANNLLFGAAIMNYFDANSGLDEIPVGFTKWGGSTLIMQPKKPSPIDGYIPPTNFTGNVYVNEGTLIIRQPDALGLATKADSDPNPNAGRTIVNGGNLEFQGVQYKLVDPNPNPQNLPQEIVEVYSGTVASTQGRAGFAGDIRSMNPDAPAVLNINGTALFEVGLTGVNPGAPNQIVGSLSGLSGFTKNGTGTLVVNGGVNIVPNADAQTGQVYQGVSDLTLTAGNSIFNGSIALGNAALNATGGNNSVNGGLTAARLNVTSGNFALNTPSATIGADLTLTGGVTLLASPQQNVAQPQNYNGAVTINGGTVVLNNSINFNGTFNYTSGALSELGNVVPGSVPLVQFTNTTPGSVVIGPATGTGVTATLQFRTIFKSAPVINPGSTLTLTGLGATTFESGINVTSTGTFNLVNAVLVGNFTANNGTQSFNGLNRVGGLLSITGGTFQQLGTRRGIVGGTNVLGIYGVRDEFLGGITINNATTTALNPNFSGANLIGGNITVQGVSSGFAGAATGTTDVTFSNNNAFTGNLLLEGGTSRGGRAIIQSAQALGDGVAAGSAGQYTIGQTGGVTITGEKAVNLIQRGTAVTGTVAAGTTAPNIGVPVAANNEDIVLGPTTGYVSGYVLTSRGTGYTGAPTVTLTNPTTPAPTTVATVTGGFTSPNVTFSNTNVGAGYVSAPTVGISGGGGTGATAIAVLAGPVLLRAQAEHNVWGGNIVLDNINRTAATGALNNVSAATPILSVNADDSVAIKGNIFGSSTVNQGTTSRLLATAVPGNPYNSSSGFIILDGQVRDNVNGVAAAAKDQLRTEWGGHNELTVLVNKEWGANGLVTLAQGMMRYTANTPGAQNTFFSTGAINVTPNFELGAAHTNQASIGWNLVNGNIGLFLTKNQQVFNAVNLTVNNGNTDKLAPASSGTTGHITIGGENTSGTVTFGTGAGVITLNAESSGQVRDLRLFAAQGGTVDIKSSLQTNATNPATSFGSITKIGDGVVRLLGSSAGAGNLTRAYVTGGTLELAGFDTVSTPRFTIATGAAGAQLFMGGGNLRVQGAPSSPVTTQFNGNFNILKGGSMVQAVENGASTNIVLGTQSTTSRAAGGTLRFVEGKANGDASTATGANIVLSATNASSGAITKNVPLGFATYGTSGDITSSKAALYFAQLSTSPTNNIAEYNPQASGPTPAYTNNPLSNNPANWANGASTHVSESTNGAGFNGTVAAGTTLMGSIRFGATNASPGVVTLPGTLALNEGILVSSDAGGANRTITGGKLINGGSMAGVAAFGGDLVIHNFGGDGISTGPSLTIGSQISSATGGKGVTLTGDGTTIFTNSTNDFSGGLYINNGVLKVSTNTQLGALSNGIFLEGGTINFTENVTTARAFTVYGDRATIKVDAGKTLLMNTSTAQFRSDGNNILGGATGTTQLYGGTNVFSGDLVLSGGGTVRQVFDNGNNPFFGQLIVSGGSRYVVEANTGNMFGNGVSYSHLDGTTVEAGSTVEFKSTIATQTNLNEFFTLAGAGQNGEGAFRMTRASTGSGSTTDRDLRILGGVTLSDNATIFVDDAPENISGGLVGILSFDDNIVEGNNKALTKTGDGILRFVNNRTQNLSTINVNGGEVRFESGITGVVGAGPGFFTPLSQYSSYFTGTNTINVGTSASSHFTANPRLWFNDARGVHTADINLNGGFMLVTSPDAPLQSVNFGGTMTVNGGTNLVPGGTNAITWDAQSGRLINNSPNALEVDSTGGQRTNPTVMFGPLNGSGSLVKFGRNELQIVNSNTGPSAFSGDLVLARGGFSTGGTTTGLLIGSPSLGLYDAGALPKVRSIHLTNDASMHLDNQNGLDTNTGNDNQTQTATFAGRINDNAELHLSGGSRFRLIGNNSAASSETMGALRIHSGASAVEMDPGVSLSTYRGVGLTFASYDRDPGSVVQFRVLGKDLTFVSPTAQNPLTNGQANLTIHSIPDRLLIGGTTGNVGDIGTGTTKNVIIGAFGGATTSAFSLLPTNTSVPVGLNNNEQLWVARSLMTWDSATHLVRPLNASEKFTPTVPVTVSNPSNQDAGDVYTFAANTAPNQNLELVGGFGPFTSAATESLTADEGLFVLPGADSSRKQDSTYIVPRNLKINSLTFAPTVQEFISAAGNRITLELKDGAKLSLSTGMILNGAYGTLQDEDSNVNDATDQRMYIRGGTIDAGSREFIIHNTAATFRENNGTWGNVNGDLNIYSSLAGSGGLTKSGLSLVQLGGQNTYTGTTTVTEGILRLVNNQALGGSNEVVITSLGDLRVARGVTIGSAANPVLMRFSNAATTNQFVSDAQYNVWYGDVQIDNVTAAGERIFNANIQHNSAAGALVLNGNIYGVDSTTGGTSPLNDVQRGRSARQLTLTNAGGVITLNGTVRDTPTGPVSSQVTSANESQTIRTFFQGNNESMYYLTQAWDSAGAIAFRQGNVQLGPSTGQFFTKDASARLNPFYGQSRPVLGDSGGDASIELTTAGQIFNAPQLNAPNATNDAAKTLISSNPTGRTAFMAMGENNGVFDATQRISTWDHIVRLYATEQGTMDVYGRITDSGGAGGFAKIGTGTVSMKGMPLGLANYSATTSPLNDVKRQIVAAGGTLELDYETNNLGAVANAWGTTALIPVLAGGRLELKGDSENATNQTWGGLTARPGGSELVIGSGGTRAMSLTIGGNFLQLPASATGTTTQPSGALNRNGASVNFVNLTPTTATLTLTAQGNTTLAATTGGSMTATPAAGGQPVVLGSWATYGTQRGQATDWAARNPANQIIPFTGYAVQDNPAAWGTGQHVSETAAGFNGNTAVTGVKTIKFGAPNAATTLNLPSNFKLGTATTADLTTADDGGILIPTGTNALKTITGGTLQVSAGTDLMIHNYGTGGLNIATTLIGTQNLVLNGPGTTTLSAYRNEFSGATYINNGVLEVSSISGNTSGTVPNGLNLQVIMKQKVDQNGDPLAGQFEPTNVVKLTGGSTTAGVFVGQNISSPLFPNGAVVTGIGTATENGQTVTALELSEVGIVNPVNANVGASGQGSFGNQLGNSVGASSTAGLLLTGGTLRYTYAPTAASPTINVATGRPVTLGGNGGTFDIANAGVTLQLDGVVTTQQNAALQTNNTSYQARNLYVGDLIKTGAGNLALNAANGYTGKTDVREGILTMLTSQPSAFGSSYGELDGTVVRGGATLRLSPTASVTTPEWITFEGGSTLDVKYGATQFNTTLDGVLTFGSRIDPGYPAPRDLVKVTYTGDMVKAGLGAQATFTAAGASGNSIISLNNNGGYLRGSAIIQKDTIWGPVNNVTTNNTVTGQGGVLIFNESSPEFTGSLIINGGRVVAKSFGVPLGVGVIPIQLGNSGSNFFSTNSINSGGTLATENVFPEANLFFQPENGQAPNGGSTSTGSPDIVVGQYRILQDVIINKPRPVLGPNNQVIKGAGSQVKQIGVTTQTNGTNMPSSQDTFNFDGRLLVDDNFNLYLDENVTLNPTGGQQVNLNLNNSLITGSPDLNPLFNGDAVNQIPAGAGSEGAYEPYYKGNITTRIVQGGRAAGADMGTYNDVFLNIRLNGDNSQFLGSWTLGNVPFYRNGAASAATGDVLISNPDSNHVLIVGNNLALNNQNQIKMMDESTLRVNGHTTTMGSLVTEGSGLDPVDLNAMRITGYVPKNSLGQTLNLENFTTADIPRNIHDPLDGSYQNFGMVRAIVENASATPGSLTINQTVNSRWNVFIRNGVQASGEAGAALSITKTGNGIAQIDNGNIYTGTTTINGGYLQVQNLTPGTSATGTGVVTINSGGGISGEGTIAGHVHVTGNLAPGPFDLLTGAQEGGLLSFEGGTSFHTGTKLNFDILGNGEELAGSAFGRDQLRTTTLTIDGQVSFQLAIDPDVTTIFPSNPVTLLGGSRFTLIESDAPIQLLPGASFDFYGQPTGIGQDIVYNYGNGDSEIFRLILDDGGRDLTLVAVPEPGTATTLLSGAAMLLGLQRFRRRSRSAGA